MFKENFLDNLLRLIKKFIPKTIFGFFEQAYHWGLSMLGAIIYGFPSRSLKIIGVTGTKGKSTTVYMITKIFEGQGKAVAAIGSLSFKIREKEWPNNLKMTMPGRFKLQKFLARAKEAKAEYVIMEVTSEGLAQHRLAGVEVDCAVFTNLHREHLESHGSFENYIKAKQKLLRKAKHIHVLNIDDPYFSKFADFPAKMKITFGRKNGLITPFQPPISNLQLQLLGDFNQYNALAALAVADAYQLDLPLAVETLNSIQSIPGRMETINSPQGFKVIIDYAHTPDSLELVYKNLKPGADELICVLGAAGGGRDKWKRPEFGRIANQYCDRIILTNEDPYDENPEEIIKQIEDGIPQGAKYKVSKILERGEAIDQALTSAKRGDIVVITGKGSETAIAVSGGNKIPWSDRESILNFLK